MESPSNHLPTSPLNEDPDDKVIREAAAAGNDSGTQLIYHGPIPNEMWMLITRTATGVVQVLTLPIRAAAAAIGELTKPKE